MHDELLKLRERLALNLVQLQSLVAKKHGMGDLKGLSPADYQRVCSMTEKLFEIWEEAEGDCDPITHDDAAFNKLARERYEIEQQIFDATGSS